MEQRSSRLALLDDFVFAAKQTGNAEPAMCSAAANHLREIKAADGDANDADVWAELRTRLSREYDIGWLPDQPSARADRRERHFEGDPDTEPNPKP